MLALAGVLCEDAGQVFAIVGPIGGGNAIAPGPVETELFVKNNPPGSAIRQQKLDKIPLGRFGRPEDVAGMVAFLMSDEATFITGQTLYVCGGSSLGSVPV